jgi:outer membrane lipoprotein-sorting protein
VSEASLEELVLTLRPPQFAIEEVEVLDRAGNRMRYRFSDLRRNRGVEAALFDFEPPPGTEIIERR